jgi:hypothetical protein
VSIDVKDARFSGVSAASALKLSKPFCSDHVAASSVRERKMLPFDHVVAVGKLLCHTVWERECG